MQKLSCVKATFSTIGLCQPLDGGSNPQYKLLHFSIILFFYKEKKALAFNRDRYCHLALCLRLILFHCCAEILPDSKFKFCASCQNFILSPKVSAIKSNTNYLCKSCSALVPKMLVKLTPNGMAGKATQNAMCWWFFNRICSVQHG